MGLFSSLLMLAARRGLKPSCVQARLQLGEGEANGEAGEEEEEEEEGEPTVHSLASAGGFVGRRPGGRVGGRAGVQCCCRLLHLGGMPTSHCAGSHLSALPFLLTNYCRRRGGAEGAAGAGGGKREREGRGGPHRAALCLRLQRAGLHEGERQAPAAALWGLGFAAAVAVAVGGVPDRQTTPGQVARLFMCTTCGPCLRLRPEAAACSQPLLGPPPTFGPRPRCAGAAGGGRRRERQGRQRKHCAPLRSRLRQHRRRLAAAGQVGCRPAGGSSWVCKGIGGTGRGCRQGGL